MAIAAKRSDKPAGKNRIILVDDHPVIRHGLRRVVELESDLEVVGEASSSAEARVLVRDAKPDMAILDISLQDGSGVDLIGELHLIHPPLVVLIASMHDESIYAERAMQAGALGYVTKETPSKLILQAIRQVLAGQIYLSPKMTRRFVQAKTSSAEPPDSLSPRHYLSDREMEVFNFIGQGMRTREIAERLHLSVKTIESYRQHIKSKLELKTSAELIRHAVHWHFQNNGGAPHDALPAPSDDGEVKAGIPIPGESS